MQKNLLLSQNNPETSNLSDFDPFMGSQQELCTHKSQILFAYVQQNHNQQFPSKLDCYFTIFFIFFVIFSVFVILVIFGLFFYPQTPGGPKFLAMELNLSQAPLRCQPASKNCFMITFFCVNSAKTLIWSFSLFWGILVGLQGGKLSHGGYLEGCTWSQTSVYQPT